MYALISTCFLEKIKQTFHSKIGESLKVNVEHPNKKAVKCFIRRPLDLYDLDIDNDRNLKSKLERFGAVNQNCSFTIKNISDDDLGEWQVYTLYQPFENNTTLFYKKNFFFTINGLNTHSNFI